MSEEEIHGLYTHEKIKCYITTTHGEGFGLPIFEAAYSGMPIVAPAFSRHLDFIYAIKKALLSFLLSAFVLAFACLRA